MVYSQLIEAIDGEQLKKGIVDFRVGDLIRVHLRIADGDKERIQIFTGTVIAKKGSGLSETFSLHRIAYGVGMERVFLLHSPKIAKIENERSGKVRRAKLYYLRGKQGKAAKVKGRHESRPSAVAVAADNGEVSGSSAKEGAPASS